MQAVTIKSSRNGIDLVLDSEVAFDELEAEVKKKFADAKKFFEGAEVVLSYRGRILSPEEETRLIADVSESAGLQVLYLADRDEFQEALIGSRIEAFRAGGMKEVQEDHLIRAHGYFAGNLHENEILESPESLLLVGNVEAGAQVLSLGNIVIFGTLSGSAHAGCGGDAGSFVAALEASPVSVTVTGIEAGEVPVVKRRFFQRKEAPDTLHPMMAVVQGDQAVWKTITKTALDDLRNRS